MRGWKVNYSMSLQIFRSDLNNNHMRDVGNIEETCMVEKKKKNLNYKNLGKYILLI